MRRSSEDRRIAILAGGGSLPREIAGRLLDRGAYVHVIAIAGAADPLPLPCPRTTVDFAQIGKMLRVLKSDALSEMLIIGSVRRPNLAAIKPDFGFFLALPTIIRLVRAGGDDAVLRSVVRFFEMRGVRIVGAADVAPELLVSVGPVGERATAPEHGADISRSFAIIRSLAPFDVGQAVVVTQGRVEAIEGAEGTDGMLQRVASLRAEHRGASSPHQGGLLVKAPKPGQELRVDLPTIGPNTIRAAVEAGLDGIALAAGQVMAAELEDLRALADRHQIFVEGIAADTTMPGSACTHLGLSVLGRRRPTRQQRLDCLKGGGVIETLAQHDVQARAVVVHRSHVLAVEMSEGVDRALARAGELRQWGRRARRARWGVAVLSSDGELDSALAEHAADIGVAGLAVLPGSAAPDVSQSAIDAANRRGLFVAALIRGQGEQE